MSSQIFKPLAFLIFILFQYSATAQEVQKNSNESVSIHDKHLINVELIGRSFVFGSINYEYSIKECFSLGIGLGINNLLISDITRLNNGVQEQGDLLEAATTQMIYGNYFIGKNRHKLFFTAGISNFLQAERQKYPSETVTFTEAELEWNAGIGYQLSGKKIKFRITAYVLALPGEATFFPKYLPWIGLSIGKVFGKA